MSEIQINQYSQLPPPLLVKSLKFHLDDFKKDPLGMTYWIRLPKVGDYLANICLVASVQSLSVLQGNILQQRNSSAFDQLEQVLLYQNEPSNALLNQTVTQVPYQQMAQQLVPNQNCYLNLSPYPDFPILIGCLDSELYIGLKFKTPPNRALDLEYQIGFIDPNSAHLLRQSVVRIYSRSLNGWVTVTSQLTYSNGCLQVS